MSSAGVGRVLGTLGLGGAAGALASSNLPSGITGPHASLWDAYRRAAESDGGAAGSTLRALQTRIDQLAEVIQHGGAGNRPQTVYMQAPQRSSAAASLSSLAVVVMTAGGAYVYIKWRGWRLEDLMYVTRKALTSAVEATQSAVAHLRQQMELRISALDGRVQLSLETQKKTLEEVDSVGKQVREVANEMGQMSQSVDQMGLEMKSLKALQFLAVKGIAALCQELPDTKAARFGGELSNLLRSMSKDPQSARLCQQGLAGLLDSQHSGGSINPTLVRLNTPYDAFAANTTATVGPQESA